MLRLSCWSLALTIHRASAGVVVGFAVIAASYSLTRKFWVDKNLRLARQNRLADKHEAAHHKEHAKEPEAKDAAPAS